MGSLWDITSKDTDFLTEKMLKILKTSTNVIEFNQALMMAKK